MAKEPEGANKGYSFGTFKGVFMPSLLTILGVVMYMRFGWVVGHVGLVQTILIVLLSTSITFLTGLSLSALATNMKVGGGGAYYIISRSLGLETGAAVGIPLYFAQATGVSFYIAGFTETLVPRMMNNTWLVDTMTGMGVTEEAMPGALGTFAGVTTLIVLALLSVKSANLALKSQFIIFALILLSLAYLFTGGDPSVPHEHLSKPIVKDLTFFAVFAVFFPAVTGIEAGIAMSGDLKNPAKSLPLGTLSAIGVSLLIYLAIPTFLYYSVKQTYPETWEQVLVNDTLIMTRFASIVSLPSWVNIVLWAIWGASISSAMGALLGAPRTMQALANDRIIPAFFGRGYGKNNDPLIASLVTVGVALVGIVAGDLNMIAPVLSMFFLTSYCLLNLSSAFEGMVGSPSWRPKFKVHWSISLLGAIACIIVMLKIDFNAALAAGAVSSGVYFYMQRRSLRARWGDVRAGIQMLLARNAIYSVSKTPLDEKTWRPNIMVLSGAPTSRWYLIRLANALSQQKGFLTVAAIVKQDDNTDRLLEQQNTIKNYLEKQDVSALVRVHQAQDGPLAAARDLIRTYGFGPLVPNTIMLGETLQSENFVEYARLIAFIKNSKRNLIMVREGKAQPIYNPTPRIDIWWRGWTNYAAFKLAIAFLMTKSEDWSNARIVLKNIVKSADQQDELKRMQAFIEHTRLEAEAEVIVSKGESIFDEIRKNSDGANLVFLGLRPPADDESAESYAKYYEQMLEDTQDMPPVIQTLNAEDVEFQRIFR